MREQETALTTNGALRFDELQASMALFAEAIEGHFVRLEVESDKAKGPDTARTGTAKSAEACIVLRDRYDMLETRAQNLGACHVDILRQLIVLEHDADLFVQRDLKTSGELPQRIFLALQALCRDMGLRRDFPGARADLERALQQARDQYEANDLPDATPLQNSALHLLEQLAAGRAPDAEAMRAASITLKKVLRLARACAQPGAQLKDCLPRTLHICTLLGHRLPDGLISVAPLSLADSALLQEEGAGEMTQTQSGKDEDGGAQNTDEHSSSADGGQLSRRHGLPGESTAQVPDFFELKSSDAEAPLPTLASDAGKPHLTGRPEARTLRSFLYPEWHYQEHRYWPAWCRVHEHRLRGDNSQFIKEVRQRHGPLAREVRQRLAAIRPNHLQRVARNVDGEEPDLEAMINMVADRHAGRTIDDRLYVQRQRTRREVSAAFLVDMSGSTNITMPSKAEANRMASSPAEEDSPYLYGGGMFTASEARPPMRRVIDVAKDALALMCDGLQGLGDRFAVYGFSGDGRKQVDFYIAKDFDEALSGRTWAALSAIEPKRSSRLGPAIRHAVHKFRGQSDVQRLLIVLSDGYPQDSDYGPDPDEVEYGIQDSGRAMAEAEEAGIQTFFITIDPAGQDYMGRICNERSSMLIDDIAELPLALSKVYGGMRRR